MLIAFVASLDSKWWICVRVFFICSFWLMTCVNIPDVFINVPSCVARLRLHDLSAGRTHADERRTGTRRYSSLCFWWRHLKALFLFSDIPECSWVISTELCCRMTYTSSQTSGHVIYSVFTCYNHSKACELFSSGTRLFFPVGTKLWNHSSAVFTYSFRKSTFNAHAKKKGYYIFFLS